MPHDEYVAWQRACIAEMLRVIKNDSAIFYNHKWRVQRGLLQEAKPKFKLVPKANALGDIWEFTQATDNPHPAPFPEQLVERIISSTYAEIVLDPFIGSGTTAIAAKKLKRNFIGIDIAAKYCAMSERRLRGEARRV